MKTTIVLEDVKLKKAFALTKIKTKTELIDVALDNLIKRYQIQNIKKYFGKSYLKIDIYSMRKREQCFS